MLQQILTISRFTLIEALRNRLFWLALVLALIAFGFSTFLADVAITEHRSIQVSVLAALLRLGGVMMMTLIVVTSVLRELNDKSLELILALNVPRPAYYFGKLAGFSLMALLLTLMFALLLLTQAALPAVIWWSLSYFCELLLVVSLGLVMLFSFKQIPAAFTAVMLFYAAARSMAAIQLMADNPIVRDTGLATQFMNGFIELLSWLLPALHGFSRTEWLVYGVGSVSDLVAVLGQTLIYTLLLSAIALFDFYRRNFA